MGDEVEEARAVMAQEQGERMLEWFKFDHLPERLRSVSRVYCLAAVETCRLVKAGPERTVALRKLLEGKDAAVRAAL
jgi:hypothetical protein